MTYKFVLAGAIGAASLLSACTMRCETPPAVVAAPPAGTVYVQPVTPSYNTDYSRQRNLR